MGLMATAIGKQAVTPMVPHIMQAALKVPFPPFHVLYTLFLLCFLVHACGPSYTTSCCQDAPFLCCNAMLPCTFDGVGRAPPPIALPTVSAHVGNPVGLILLPYSLLSMSYAALIGRALNEHLI